MLQLAQEHDFEGAALVRDQIKKLKGEAVASPQKKKRRGGKPPRKGSSMS
jgi:hypothetical protein